MRNIEFFYRHCVRTPDTPGIDTISLRSKMFNTRRALVSRGYMNANPREVYFINWSIQCLNVFRRMHDTPKKY